MYPMARGHRSRIVTDVPVAFTKLRTPNFSPRWTRNYIWLISGRGNPMPKYASDIREILAENSIKDYR